MAHALRPVLPRYPIYSGYDFLFWAAEQRQKPIQVIIACLFG
ncbi:hypothetical protein [Acetobacter garciniae]|nr:hypothetical protein [Acetobacter garciniae]